MHLRGHSLSLLAVVACLAVIEIRGGSVLGHGGLHSARPGPPGGGLHVHRTGTALAGFRGTHPAAGCGAGKAAGRAGSSGVSGGGDPGEGGLVEGGGRQGAERECWGIGGVESRPVLLQAGSGGRRSLSSAVEWGISLAHQRMRLRGGADMEVDQRGVTKRSRSRRNEADSSQAEDGAEAKANGKDEPESRMDTEGTGRASSEPRDEESKVGGKRGNLRERVLDLSSRSFDAKMRRHKEYKTWTAQRKRELDLEVLDCERQQAELIDDLKTRMIDLLSWREKKTVNNCTHVVPGESVLETCFECTKVAMPPEHSRGGFACVLLDVENGIAFRLEPMKNMIDAAAWLGFHIVLEMFGLRAALSVKYDRPKAVLTVDRMMSSDQPYSQWNHTPMVRLYQEPTLAAFSKHVVKHRNKILRKAQQRRAAAEAGDGDKQMDANKENKEGGENKQEGSGQSAMPDDKEEEGPTKGGIIAANDEKNRMQSCLLTPRAWFWHPIVVPVVPEVENGSITENDRHRRVRGKELADALCGQDGSAERKSNGETRVVKLLCTVFDLASTDLATVARSHWRNGSPDDVPIKVVENVGQALRGMHACAIAHGDVKMANILHMGDIYWLGDLPALTRATTKMLTNDPVCSTQLLTGKRMLANDMWGLGLITITLLAGSSPFKKVCEKLRGMAPPANSGPLWTIFCASFLHALAHLVPSDSHILEASRAVKQLLSSPTGRKMIKPISKENREVCRAEGDAMAHTILKHKAAPSLFRQLAYCLDISNVARNALAMVLPSEVDSPDAPDNEISRNW